MLLEMQVMFIYNKLIRKELRIVTNNAFVVFNIRQEVRYFFIKKAPFFNRGLLKGWKMGLEPTTLRTTI